LKVKTFPSGIHPREHKEATREKIITEAPIPDELVLPLQQSAGVACAPLVQVRDRVLAAQKIADTEALISAPLHSPVSGVIKAIEPRPHHTGLKIMSIVIAPDETQEWVELKPGPADPTPEQIREAVREAGIVGLGGAAFPTKVKISPPAEMKIDTIIINGCECEPYLTVDHRLMVESPGKIIDGLKLLVRTVGAERGIIGIEDNKPEAIAAISKEAEPAGFEVVILETKYPQGAEKQLIHAALGRQVPSGALPGHVGVLVQNVGTAAAISEAVREGQPLIRRAVTVSGSGIIEPKNLRVSIGTPVRNLVALCGGLKDAAAKIIVGGPMMGVALSSLDVPVVKATSGIIALSEEEASGPDAKACIKCGRCVEACPMGLMPSRLSVMTEIGIWDEMKNEHVFDCVECGSCTFVCPAARPIVQHIRLAKYELKKDKT
jgi:electron transport complex protein RnfC